MHGKECFLYKIFHICGRCRHSRHEVGAKSIAQKGEELSVRLRIATQTVQHQALQSRFKIVHAHLSSFGGVGTLHARP